MPPEPTTAPDPAAAAAPSILDEIDQAIRGLILPAHQQTADEAAIHADQLLYDEQMNAELLADMGRMTAEDPQKVAVGVMGIVTLLREQPKWKFDDAAMVPVSSLVAISLMRFMADSGMLEPQAEFIGNVFEEMYALLLQKFHVGRDDLEAMLSEDEQKSQSLNPNDPEQLLAQQDPAQPPQPPQPGLIDGAMA